MVQLEEWFKSWVPDLVFSAGSGRMSVEAWSSSALDMEEVLIVAADSHVHLFVSDVVKSFDTVDVKTTPQMTRFRGAIVCNNLATDEIDDHRIQSDYKYKSELQNPEGKKSVLGITSAW